MCALPHTHPAHTILCLSRIVAPSAWGVFEKLKPLSPNAVNRIRDRLRRLVDSIREENRRESGLVVMVQ
jgi:hypothetical protein